jgi:hypothetical protein
MNLEEIKESILKDFDKEVVDAVENSDILRCACDLVSALSEEYFFNLFEHELISALRETVYSAGKSRIMLKKSIYKYKQHIGEECRIEARVHNYRACLFANLAVSIIARKKESLRLAYVQMMKEYHCPEDILNAALVEIRSHEKTTC